MKRCEHLAQEIALESELSKTIFVHKVYADMVGMTFCPSNHKYPLLQMTALGRYIVKRRSFYV